MRRAVLVASGCAAIALIGVLQVASLSGPKRAPASTTLPSHTHIHPPSTLPVPHATRSYP